MGANMVVAIFTMFIISYWASKFIVGDNKAHVSDWTERGSVKRRARGGGEKRADGGGFDAISHSQRYVALVGWL